MQRVMGHGHGNKMQWVIVMRCKGVTVIRCSNKDATSYGNKVHGDGNKMFWVMVMRCNGLW